MPTTSLHCQISQSSKNQNRIFLIVLFLQEQRSNAQFIFIFSHRITHKYVRLQMLVHLCIFLFQRQQQFIIFFDYLRLSHSFNLILQFKYIQFSIFKKDVSYQTLHATIEDDIQFYLKEMFLQIELGLKYKPCLIKKTCMRYIQNYYIFIIRFYV